MSKTDDLFESVLDRLVASISEKEHTWTKPWTAVLGAHGLGTNASTNNAYRGFNQFVLLVEQAVNDYSLPLWATYKQWQALGGQVRKGETGTQLVKWGKTYFCETDEDYKGKDPCPKEGHPPRFHMWASAFTVFNVDQQDGYVAKTPDLGPEPERMEAVEAFVAATGATLRHVAGDKAYYHRGSDLITLPLREQFEDARGYYGTVLHELTHWTGADHRLKRDKGRVFGDDNYAGEELVAELGATFLAAKFNVETEPHVEHAAYLSSWLGKLKEDPRALYRAAGAAQQAVAYLEETVKKEKVAA